jgi:hypothetical protein
MSDFDSLWSTYVDRDVERPEADEEQEALALRRIKQYRADTLEAEKRGDADAARVAWAQANIVWQLLASRIGRSLLRDGELREQDDITGPSSRTLLRMYLLASSLSWSPHRWGDLIVRLLAGRSEEMSDIGGVEFLVRGILPQAVLSRGELEAIDPIAVFLPRHLLDELLDAFGALEWGEVRPMVTPTPTKQRGGLPWVKTRLRLRALELVAFLEGRGSSKGDAQECVADAIGVSFDTLRSWEAILKQHPHYNHLIQFAWGAGRADETEDDPVILQTLSEMEPLEEFATV